MKNLWNWFWNTSNRLVFALILFITGIIAWGGFNTAMEYTNTMEFCIGCHEMEDNVYAEYKGTIHFHNRSGVQAGCPDCHVPKEWGPKMVRKIQASKELLGKAMGIIDTKEKFEEHRLTMAQSVWAAMRANGSQECKNCHSYEAMHAEKQGDRAKKMMAEAAKTDAACIDCHKGIAHKLPKFDKIYAGWAADVKTAVEGDSLSVSTLYAAMPTTLYLEQNEESDVVANVHPLTELSVVEKAGDWLKVKLVAWDREGGAQLFAKAGPLYEVAKLGGAGFDVVKQTEEWVDQESELTWNKASVEGWVKKGSLTSDMQVVSNYAEKLWDADCGLCHTRYDADRYNAFDWVKRMKAMRRFTHLEQDQQLLVLKYLQAGSSDMVAKK
ncbi:NapC/NirT family cytochrome c [Terasakiella sp. A23]|uniref:NapC/NirT family cytochrome c n=1 Tax=Terasakiella sp. FCG-A23 TaxID=3080561 RepID=UPI002955C0FB|nr:NapC/NirT family cytochrome c [Terasakiella sp. A23]MDV7339147.1 NapC/NirT family cytochrome c [Terasakiella sp. A23]